MNPGRLGLVYFALITQEFSNCLTWDFEAPRSWAREELVKMTPHSMAI